VIAYNQARFVRHAVEAALAQTYSPLEVLLSDDCSTDGTFEIIQDVVSQYSGPHKVIVNRNDRNLGLSEHVNRIIALAQGELIIAADGDDLSGPQRAERCVEAWLNHGKPAALMSAIEFIDADGKISPNADEWFSQFLPIKNETQRASLLRFCSRGSPRLISCSAAWTKEMFNAFGPMSPGLWYEDDVITVRAWLFDRIVFLQDVLVSYRQHESNLFNRVKAHGTTAAARRRMEQLTRLQAERHRESLLSYVPDLEIAIRQQWITQALCDELRRRIDKQARFYEVIATWWNVAWTERLEMFLFVLRWGRFKEARWCLPRLAPFSVFLYAAAIWSRACTGRWSSMKRLEGAPLS
jgi:glycosyltransferase involved in cell wall biosynthesis